jgi:hypothetical protein
MKTTTSVKAVTNTSLVIATAALVAAALFALASVNFSVIDLGLNNNTPIKCAGPGLSAAIYGGGKCCTGLILQGGICNTPPPTCAKEGQALGPAATIKCCTGLVLQNGVCKKCIGAGLPAGTNPCCENLILQGGLCNTPPATCAKEGTVLGPSATIKCCAGLTLVGGKCTKTCVPNCVNKKCGSDGCGGSCGACLATQTCSTVGQCVNIFSCTGITPVNSTLCAGDDVGLIRNTPKTLVTLCGIAKCEYKCNAGYVKSGTSCVKVCTANCTGKCGGASDGCSGTCNAACSTGQTCQNGQCVTACIPNCSGKTCGDDGCGGNCGTCATGYICINDVMSSTYSCKQQCFTPNASSLSVYSNIYDLPCGYIDGSYCVFVTSYTTPIVSNSGQRAGIPLSNSAWGITTCANGCTNTSTAVGNYAGTCDTGTATSTGTLDTSSPPKQILIGNAQKVNVMAFKLQVNSAEAVDLKEVKITNTSGTPVVGTWYLYASSRADGGSVADPVAVAAGGTIADFIMPANVVTIPSSGSVIMVVKIDVALVDDFTVTNGTQFYPWVSANSDIKATGKSSGATINITSAPIKANGPDYVYGTRPYFSVNAVSPSGTLVPGMNSLIAIFNVKADDGDDVTFTNTAGNLLKIDIASTNLAALGNFVLKDETGQALDPASGVGGGVFTCAFATHDFVVSKGQTKKLYLYGDTSGLVTNNSVQAWLNDSSTNIGWSVNYDGGNYDRADIIFRGGIYAGALKV